MKDLQFAPLQCQFRDTATRLEVLEKHPGTSLSKEVFDDFAKVALQPCISAAFDEPVFSMIMAGEGLVHHMPADDLHLVCKLISSYHCKPFMS